jgi:hypothetical protein
MTAPVVATSSARLAFRICARQTQPVRTTAIIAAHNDEDIIAQVVGDLIDQGVSVYVIDCSSRDAVAAAATPLVGSGLIAIERFAGDAAALLRRKEELARTLDCDWLIHGDADELRESPWSDRNLGAAIASVDRLGFNTIDFEVFRFAPTRDDLRASDALREFYRFCEPPASAPRPHLSCWKKHDAIDLVSSGGYEAHIPWQRVFPVRFILRKYDRARAGDPVAPTAPELRRFDSEAARLHVWLNHADVEARRRELDAIKQAHQAREQQLDAALQHERRQVAGLDAELRRLRVQLDTTWAHVQELLGSRTWRWTRPARLAWRLMGKP